MKENYNGFFESKWLIKIAKSGCFWDYENDHFNDLTIKYIDMNTPSSNENQLFNFDLNEISSMVIRKEYSCKNGIIKFEFMIIGNLLFKIIIN